MFRTIHAIILHRDGMFIYKHPQSKNEKPILKPLASSSSLAIWGEKLITVLLSHLMSCIYGNRTHTGGIDWINSTASCSVALAIGKYHLVVL